MERGWTVEVHQEARAPQDLQGTGSGTVSALIDGRLAARGHLRPSGSTSVVATWDPAAPGPARVRLHVDGVGRIIGRLMCDRVPVAGEQVGAGPTRWIDPQWFPRERTPIAQMTSRDDGTFEIVGLRAGNEYAIEAGGRAYVRTVHGPFPATPEDDGTVLELELKRGALVLGRILDEARTPLTGSRVHVYRDQSAGPVMGSVYVESTWTDGDGRFQFAASPTGEALLLKTLVRREDAYLCLQRRLVPLAPGEERQIGDLAAGGVRLTFALVDEDHPTQYEAVFSALGDGSDTHPSMALGGLEFDERGECHVIGVPRGDVSWHVASVAPNTDASAGGETHVARDTVIDVGIVVREVPADLPTTTVRLQFDAHDEREMDVMLTRDDAIERRFKRIGLQGQLEFETTPGRVRVIVRTQDGALWDETVEGVASGVESPRVRPERSGITALVRVLADDVPVTDAEIAMIGLARGARGLIGNAVFDARTDEDGRFEIHGLPDKIDGVRVVVMRGGTGLMRFVPREEFDDATIDLSPR